jgi:hypothetical protein
MEKIKKLEKLLEKLTDLYHESEMIRIEPIGGIRGDDVDWFDNHVSKAISVAEDVTHDEIEWEKRKLKEVNNAW